MTPLHDSNSLGLPAWALDEIDIRSSQDLYGLLPRLEDRPRLILGGGTNVLLNTSAANPLQAVVLRNRLRGIVRLGSLPDGRQLIRCGGGESWHRFVMWTLAQGLGGLENLALIPGTVGAAPVQNIGAYGVEVADRLHAVHVWDFAAQDFASLEPSECAFGYRESCFKDPARQGPWNQPRWLISAVDFALWPAARSPRVVDYSGLRDLLPQDPADQQPLKIAHAVMVLRRQKLPDPDDLPNAGSFFKNPVVPEVMARQLADRYPEMPVFLTSTPGEAKLSAGWLIQTMGLKGHRKGDAGVYEHHALVLVNHGNALASDILGLAHDIQQAVMGHFGIWLEREPVMLPP